MGRPSDNAQPSSKRRPGEQLTKDNADSDDDGGPAVDPGTWGKADQATMARRKVVRARRAGGPAEPAAAVAAAAAPADAEQPAAAASSNPFAGVSLTAAAVAAPAANPFAGISMTATAKAPDAAARAAALPSSSVAAEPAKDGAETAAAAAPSSGKPGEAAAAAAADADGEPAAVTDEAKAETAGAPAGAAAAADAADAAAKPAAAGDAPGSADKDKPAGTSSFGGSAGGGGFGSLGASGGGFGSLAGGAGFGGFGGFAAAAKDGGSGGGSLFGSYTAPQPSGLFAPTPAFGAPSAAAAPGAKAGGDEEEGDDAGGDAGNAVFGGNDVAPVVSLSEVPKQTGEEEEAAVYTADGALFEFADGKEWRERGRGELRVNVHASSGQARLVMRQRGSQRLLLNANLYPKMATSRMVGGKGVTFAAVNAAAPSSEAKEGPGGGADDAAPGSAGKEAGGKEAAPAMRTYAFRVKSAERIDAFVATVDAHKAAKGSGSAAPAAAVAAGEEAA